MKKCLYYLLDRSPWPILSATAVFFITSGFVLYIHRVENGFMVFGLRILVILSLLKKIIYLIIYFFFLFIIFITIFFIYYIFDMNFILNIVKKLSWSLFIKFGLSLLIMVSLKLGLNKFRDRLVIIKKYFMKYKIIMFIVGLFIGFFNIFNRLFLGDENISFAGSKEDREKEEIILLSIGFISLLVFSATFIIYDQYNFSYNFHRLRMQSPYVIYFVYNIWEILLAANPGLFNRKRNFQIALDIVYWAYINNSELLIKYKIDSWSTANASINYPKIVTLYNEKFNVIANLQLKEFKEYYVNWADIEDIKRLERKEKIKWEI